MVWSRQADNKAGVLSTSGRHGGGTSMQVSPGLDRLLGARQSAPGLRQRRGDGAPQLLTSTLLIRRLCYGGRAASKRGFGGRRRRPRGHGDAGDNQLVHCGGWLSGLPAEWIQAAGKVPACGHWAGAVRVGRQYAGRPGLVVRPRVYHRSCGGRVLHCGNLPKAARWDYEDSAGRVRAAGIGGIVGACSAYSPARSQRLDGSVLGVESVCRDRHL